MATKRHPTRPPRELREKAKRFDALHERLLPLGLHITGTIDGGNGIWIGQEVIRDAQDRIVPGSMRLLVQLMMTNDLTTAKALRIVRRLVKRMERRCDNGKAD